MNMKAMRNSNEQCLVAGKAASGFQQPNQSVRCAIYARYDSTDQNPESNQVEAQIRRCKKYADQEGWTVLKEFAKADVAVSGAFRAGREALESLLSAAKQSHRRFDCVLAVDLARFGRNF